MTTETVSLHLPRWTFADRLRKIRRESGLTQAEFASRIGAKEKAYAAWEIGSNEPRDIVSVARRIELAFRVPAAWMLGLDVATPHPDGGPSPSLPEEEVRHQGLEPRTRCYEAIAA